MPLTFVLFSLPGCEPFPSLSESPRRGFSRLTIRPATQPSFLPPTVLNSKCNLFPPLGYRHKDTRWRVWLRQPNFSFLPTVVPLFFFHPFPLLPGSLVILLFFPARLRLQFYLIHLRLRWEHLFFPFCPTDVKILPSLSFFFLVFVFAPLRYRSPHPPIDPPPPALFFLVFWNLTHINLFSSSPCLIVLILFLWPPVRNLWRWPPVECSP